MPVCPPGFPRPPPRPPSETHDLSAMAERTVNPRNYIVPEPYELSERYRVLGAHLGDEEHQEEGVVYFLLRLESVSFIRVLEVGFEGLRRILLVVLILWRWPWIWG